MDKAIDDPQSSGEDRIVVVTGDPVLALDICDAIVTLGLPAPVVLPVADEAQLQAMPCAALIVDADVLDDPGAMAVRDRISARRPVVAIADNGEIARRMQVPDALWFPKPVSADHLAVCIVDLVRRLRVGGCGTGVQP